MPYTKGGPYVTTGAFSAANGNNLETQYDEATQSLGPDEVAAFVLSGGTGTIHGGSPKQLDVTTCVYYALQTDGTTRRRQVNATNFTTVTISTTYFLDYNPDGSTSFATSHSGAANYVPIISLTTDGSGNINVITDARPTAINQFPTAVGAPKFAGKFLILTGTHNGVAFTLSAGNGAPGSLDTNEIYFQLT
jgi:hypothetical protein